MYVHAYNDICVFQVLLLFAFHFNTMLFCILYIQYGNNNFSSCSRFAERLGNEEEGVEEL